MIDFPRIRAFLAVADCLNFTQAAEELYMSQSALSKTVAHLEAEFGFPLFVRTRRSVTLTREGEMLRSRLGEAVNAIETAIAEAKQMQRGKIGAVSLAVANVSVLSPTLLSILNRFSADHTNYDLRIGLCARPAHEKLLQDEADAVITTGNVFKSLHNLSTMTLFESKPVIICRKQHPVLGCNAGASLSQYPFISLTSPASPSGPDYLQTVCKRLGFSPRIAECAASLDELAVKLLLSDALGVVPDHFAAVHTDTTASIPLPSEMPEQIVIAWKQSNTNPVLHKLIAFLQDAISESQ